MCVANYRERFFHQLEAEARSWINDISMRHLIKHV